MSGTGSQFPRNIFVLDISGSMGGGKCQTLQLSVTRFIDELPDMSYVGVVLFDDFTELRHKVVQITDTSVRDRLIQSVPAMNRGGTDIGSGILFGVQAFRDQNIDTVEAKMILVTDGGDTSGTNYVDRVLPTLLSAKIRVICIAIGTSADPNLDRLAKETNGSIFSANSTDRDLMARIIQSSIQEVKTSKELAESVNISVVNDSLKLTQTNATKNVTIDSDIGRNTVFSIESQDFDKISVSIQSPNGHKYDSTSAEFTKNVAMKRTQLKLTTTESGVWVISLTKHTTQTIRANIVVMSQPIHPNAVQMKVTLKEADSNNPPIIIAELRKGRDAVVGAEVMATIDKPDGTQSQLKLNNFNNIYCNYFTDYCGSDRYNVTVRAHSYGSNCHLNALTSKTPVSGVVPQFERQLIKGCFKITDSMPKRPIDDQILEDLSLSSSFNSMSLNLSVGSVEAPAARTAKAVIKPRVRAVPQTDDIIKSKEKIQNLLFLLKKSINSTKISDNERNLFKKTMEDIDTKLNAKTSEELKDYLKQLEDFKRKLL